MRHSDSNNYRSPVARYWLALEAEGVVSSAAAVFAPFHRHSSRDLPDSTDVGNGRPRIAHARRMKIAKDESPAIQTTIITPRESGARVETSRSVVF